MSRKLVRCALVGIGGAGERADADEEGRNASSKPPLRRGAVCACTVQSCVRFDWRVTRLKGRAVVHQDVEQRLRTTELTDGLQVAIELHELIHGHEHALQHERLRSGEETPQGSAPLMGKGGGGLPATALRAACAAFGGPRSVHRWASRGVWGAAHACGAHLTGGEQCHERALQPILVGRLVGSKPLEDRERLDQHLRTELRLPLEVLVGELPKEPHKLAHATEVRKEGSVRVVSHEDAHALQHS